MPFIEMSSNLIKAGHLPFRKRDEIFLSVWLPEALSAEEYETVKNIPVSLLSNLYSDIYNYGPRIEQINQVLTAIMKNYPMESTITSNPYFWVALTEHLSLLREVASKSQFNNYEKKVQTAHGYLVQAITLSFYNKGTELVDKMYEDMIDTSTKTMAQHFDDTAEAVTQSYEDVGALLYYVQGWKIVKTDDIFSQEFITIYEAFLQEWKLPDGSSSKTADS